MEVCPLFTYPIIGVTLARFFHYEVPFRALTHDLYNPLLFAGGELLPRECRGYNECGQLGVAFCERSRILPHSVSLRHHRTSLCRRFRRSQLHCLIRKLFIIFLLEKVESSESIVVLSVTSSV